MAETEMAPPADVGDGSMSALLLARNNPPEPGDAVRVLTAVWSTAPLVPIPLDAVRTSVSADTLIALPFGAKRAPPALRVTVPKAEITPRVMSPVVA